MILAAAYLCDAAGKWQASTMERSGEAMKHKRKERSKRSRKRGEVATTKTRCVKQISGGRNDDTSRHRNN